jgi:hypothetical protein
MCPLLADRVRDQLSLYSAPLIRYLGLLHDSDFLFLFFFFYSRHTSGCMGHENARGRVRREDKSGLICFNPAAGVYRREMAAEADARWNLDRKRN